MSMKNLKRITAVVLAAGLVSTSSSLPTALAQPAADEVKLNAETFGPIHKQIKPQPGESRWMEIPWQTSLWTARELAAKNIRVNTIAPGSILFPGGSWHQRQQSDPDGIAEFVSRELPFGRFGRAEEVGDAVAWLASPRASWVSGACLPVDGCQGRSNI